MARTDEMFAVIQKHVARLKNRGPSPHKDLADKTIKTIAHTITLPNANSSASAEEKSPIKVEYLLTADNSSFHTLYSPDQHVQHYVQNTEAQESQEPCMELSLSSHCFSTSAQPLRYDVC